MTVPKSRDQFTVLDGNSLQNTLVRKLTHVADKVRDLGTKLGGYEYQVSLVRTRWSGGKRGNGTESVVSATPLLPTPKLISLDGQILTLQAVGLDEVGTVIVRQISPAYTEDELRGLGPQGEPIPPDQNFYYEIVLPRPLPEAAVRRRYQLRGTPDYQPTRFGWSVTLLKAGEERDRVTQLPEGD
jgi:hypothetical protein